MLIKLGITLICCLLFFNEACGSKSARDESPSAATTTSAAQPSADASPQPAFDACALLDKSEIAAVQGFEVQQVQPTTQKNGDLDISQCYYTVVSSDGSKNLSVYLQVIQLNPKATEREALKEFWEERFERESVEKKREAKEAREEEEEAINPPRRISGVGDKAFWLGSSRGGALFVLKKDKVLRVTVGGTNDAAKAQIEKSKTLANKALARLM